MSRCTGIEQSEIGLRLAVALFGRLFQPNRILLEVLSNSESLSVHLGQPELPLSVTGLRKREKLFECGREILLGQSSYVT